MNSKLLANHEWKHVNRFTSLFLEESQKPTNMPITYFSKSGKSCYYIFEDHIQTHDDPEGHVVDFEYSERIGQWRKYR